MPPLYPLFLKLDGRACVVAGGGPVAADKVRSLLEAGARVRVISPELSADLAALARDGRISWAPRRFEAGDLAGAFLAIAATGDAEVSRAVFEEGERRGMLVNAVDQDEFSSCHAPAIARRGDIQAAVSTAGKSPAFAARLRERLAARLSDADARFADSLGRLRPKVLARFASDPERRKRIFQALVAAYADPEPGAGRRRPAARRGKVYLVGAGPGDAGLLTLRGAALLESADVVYYDRLVGPAVLERISPRAKRVYVGREAGGGAPATGALLVEAARAGQAVVRLKGGDPNLFGRGGDEMLALRRAGIPFEVVSGVSALTAVPSAAGIPVTFRGLAHQVVVRSGYRDLEPETSRLRPASAAESTYVYFMTAGRLSEIVRELLESDGLPEETPIAVIQRGTWPDQDLLSGSLGTILDQAARAPLRPPALVVAGGVVRFLSADLLEHGSAGEAPEGGGDAGAAPSSRAAAPYLPIEEP
jgi:uroporphyrin-III C-methyltransferase/precorrin-2 dehydrogenase/sirohydrochlorin ferrochelatase